MANPENNISNDGIILYADAQNVFRDHPECVKIADDYKTLEDFLDSPRNLLVAGQVVTGSGKVVIVSIETILEDSFTDTYISVGAEDYRLTSDGVDKHSRPGEVVPDSSIRQLIRFLTRVVWNEEQTERLWWGMNEEIVVPGSFTLEDEK